MNRRALLRGAGTAWAAGVAGCLGRLGFEEESAWANQPVVEDRPDAVYLPASTEEMARYGSATDGEYAVALTYTFPHRFWTVTDGDRERVSVDSDDTLHLMCSVWDPEHRIVLPVDVELSLSRDGDPVATLAPWAMLSQRMGFHYGDNVTLPDEGEYTAEIRVGPVQARRTGAFEGRFETATTLEVDFAFDRSDVHDLALDPVPESERGRRDALALMEHDRSGGGSDEHETRVDDDRDGRELDAETGPPPTSRGPPIDDLPGRHLGTDRTGDAAVTLLVIDDGELAPDDADTYLAVFPRTPHNDVILPFTSLTLTQRRDGEPIREAPLRETVDPGLGHHYGVGVDLESDDRLRVSFDTAPIVARHDGYETAFFDFDPLEIAI